MRQTYQKSALSRLANDLRIVAKTDVSLFDRAQKNAAKKWIADQLKKGRSVWEESIPSETWVLLSTDERVSNTNDVLRVARKAGYPGSSKFQELSNPTDLR